MVSRIWSGSESPRQAVPSPSVREHRVRLAIRTRNPRYSSNVLGPVVGRFHRRCTGWSGSRLSRRPPESRQTIPLPSRVNFIHTEQMRAHANVCVKNRLSLVKIGTRILSDTSDHPFRTQERMWGHGKQGSPLSSESHLEPRQRVPCLYSSLPFFTLETCNWSIQSPGRCAMKWW
jgi:hypothetical protein